jgi:hypothetical protein
METVGREAEGWTEQRAQRALGAKLDAVERGLRKPKRHRFSDLIDEFEAVALPAKRRKKSTLVDYRIVARDAIAAEPEHEDKPTPLPSRCLTSPFAPFDG